MIVKKEVSKENILKKITTYDIFKKYVSNFEQIGKLFCSELRKDRNPTCVISVMGIDLKYRDYSESRSIDCFQYIMEKYSVTFPQSLEMVNQDFDLGLLSKCNILYNPTPSVIHDLSKIEITKSPTEIKVQIRLWNKYDKRYWKDKYDIGTEELSRFKVYPLSGYWLNGHYYKCVNLTYGYYFGKLEDGREAWKIYAPYEKKLDKWRSNTPEFIFQGFDQLPWVGERLIITKSLKDVIVLSKIGIPAIAPQGEAIIITKEFLDSLRKRFKEIRLLYDNDTPGIKCATKISDEHELKSIYLPEGTKDSSDFVELYSYEVLNTFIEESW